MLHVNNPLRQFADITDPLLSTALFSRFYSYMIHLLLGAINAAAASYLAK